MSVKNFEFKARVEETDSYEKKLNPLNPKYKGLDHQIDTYFKVKKGRLKLREGTIENALIDYEREDIKGAKRADIILYKHQPDPALKTILTKHLGIKVIVEKERKIYFVGNVKIHFDKVEDLGHFIEVEAIDRKGDIPLSDLKEQCFGFIGIFGIEYDQMVDQSYSDLLLNQRRETPKLSPAELNDIVQDLDMGMLVFIHKETKDIISVANRDDAFYEDPEGIWSERYELIDSDPDYIQIEKWPSHKAFEIMDGFVDEIDDRQLKIALLQALENRKPFRNFKNIIENSAYREDWFSFRSKKEEELLKEMLKVRNIK